jgi:hypothetical protein
MIVRQAVIGVSIIGAALAVPAYFVLSSGAVFGGAGKAGAISERDYLSIKVGESRVAVERALGTPEHGMVDVTHLPAAPAGTECAYYDDSSDAIQDGEIYRFCYAEGMLVLKAAYPPLVGRAARSHG